MKKKTSSSIICQNFKIPQQTIFQDYKCSYKSSLTYFGRLYVGQEHVCFIANMFGILKKCVIQIDRIEKLVEPGKFCLAIEESQRGGGTAEYSFSGFKTNHAYTLIKALWKKETIESEVLNANDDEEGFIMPGESGEVNREKLIDQGNVESSFFNPKVVEVDRQKICEFQLPCSVEQYYNFFLADNASVYPRKKHLQLRDSKEITVTPWRKSEELDSQIKQINALIRVQGVPFVNYAHLSQVWKLKKNESNELSIEFVTQMGDVPYSNYFVVNNYVQVLKDGDTKCKMSVEVSVVFNKSTYMKGTILGRTFPDVKEDYNFWFGQVKSILEKMKKSQEQESMNKLRGSRLSKTQAEFESNDVSTVESMFQGLSGKNSHIRSLQVPTDTQIGRLQKKIEVMSKFMLILLIMVLAQLVINGLMYYQMNADRHEMNAQCQTTHHDNQNSQSNSGQL